MTPKAFAATARALASANGLSQDTAEDYLSAMGDTRETDADGKIIIRGPDGQILARLNNLEEAP